MKAKYDTEELAVTPRYIDALKELMWAEMEMMRLDNPSNASCWAWGICEVGDLASSIGLSIEYGSEEDKPDDFPQGTDVWVRFCDTGS